MGIFSDFGEANSAFDDLPVVCGGLADAVFDLDRLIFGDGQFQSIYTGVEVIWVD